METRAESITDRQLEVARLVAEGRSNPEIAEVLGISLAGAKYHVSELLGRLGLERREQVAEWVLNHPEVESASAPVHPRSERRLPALWIPVVALGALLPAILVAVALGGGLAGDEPTATPLPPPLVAATEIVEGTPTAGETSAPASPTARPTVEVVAGWVWPVTGEVITPFGPSSPLGVDIAAEVGTPVLAARSGVISLAGGNPCCDYGYHVVIDHGDGFETLYAHLSDFAVTTGSLVNAGDTIGWVGFTGRTEGPRLHFEIHRDGTYQDPVAFLP